MQQVKGELIEIWLESGGLAGRVVCPDTLTLAPGQYLAAYCREDPLSVLAHPLFMAGAAPGGMRLAPPLPDTWQPGCALELRGPLGHGFNLPISARHVGLAALDASPSRLLSLAELALVQGSEVALFCDLAGDDLPWRSLPPAMEISPTNTLHDVFPWLDYLALDVPITRLAGLHSLVGMRQGERLPFGAEVLVAAPMPCAGLAGCGACAVQTRHGWALACEDGPVFAWERLE